MPARLNIVGVIGLLLGAMIVVATLEYPAASAAFPRVIGYAMIVLGAIEVVRTAFFGPNAAEEAEQAADRDKPRVPLKPVLLFIAVTLAYVVLIPVIGFYVTSFVYILGLLLLLGVRKPWLFLGLPVAFVAIVYITFTMQLNVPLPQGIAL